MSNWNIWPKFFSIFLFVHAYRIDFNFLRGRTPNNSTWSFLPLSYFVNRTSKIPYLLFCFFFSFLLAIINIDSFSSDQFACVVFGGRRFANDIKFKLHRFNQQPQHAIWSKIFAVFCCCCSFIIKLRTFKRWQPHAECWWFGCYISLHVFAVDRSVLSST